MGKLKQSAKANQKGMPIHKQLALGKTPQKEPASIKFRKGAKKRSA